MTSYDVVYQAFLAKMLEDEWQNWTIEEMKFDLRDIMEGAITWFKFPRISLERNDNGFIEDLTNDEIQVIAEYMVYEWDRRTLMSWENTKPLYEERDFSQANLVDSFANLAETQLNKAVRRERMYYRSIKGEPFDYGKWAGG